MPCPRGDSAGDTVLSHITGLTPINAVQQCGSQFHTFGVPVISVAEEMQAETGRWRCRASSAGADARLFVQIRRTSSVCRLSCFGLLFYRARIELLRIAPAARVANLKAIRVKLFSAPGVLSPAATAVACDPTRAAQGSSSTWPHRWQRPRWNTVLVSSIRIPSA